MHVSQEPYRRLYEQILRSTSPVYRGTLQPWLTTYGAVEREWLTETVAQPDEPSGSSLAPEALWRLYALSRVNQLLMLAFQEGDADGAWSGPELSLRQYSHFFAALGFKEREHPRFHPFFHEIVDVVEPDDDADEAPGLRAVHWPCLMLGSLMFSRAGVSIRTADLDRETAARTTLYWALRRKHRKCLDLSHGWGSNSQWRTEFRRDYLLTEQYVYNVDGATELKPFSGVDENGLSYQDALDFVRYRCLVR
ncbi:MAG: hypothetical protein AAFY60_15450, partial [Myxococcota bacterium]